MFVCFWFASLGCAVVLFQNENCTDKHKHSRRVFGFAVTSMKENPKILLFYTNQPPFLVKHFACEIQQARQTRKINERRYNKQDNKQDKHPSKTESSATIDYAAFIVASGCRFQWPANLKENSLHQTILLTLHGRPATYLTLTYLAST